MHVPTSTAMTPDQVLAKAYALSGPHRRMWRTQKPLKMSLPSTPPSSSAKAKPDDILAAATMHSQRTPRVWGACPVHPPGSLETTTTKRKTHDLLDAHNGQPCATPLLDHAFTKPATRPRSSLALADLMEDCILHDKLSEIVERERPPLSSDSESDLDDDSVALVRQALYQGIPANTVKAELSAWKSWSAACGRLHLSKWRGRKAGHKESLKLGRIVLDIYHHMRPRRRTDPAAKPESAYKVYLNVRRLMKREGYECPHLHLILAEQNRRCHNQHHSSQRPAPCGGRALPATSAFCARFGRTGKLRRHATRRGRCLILKTGIKAPPTQQPLRSRDRAGSVSTTLLRLS